MRKSVYVALTAVTLSLAYNGAAWSQATQPIFVPPPPNVTGVANSGWRQHDLDKVEAESRVRGGEILRGDRYALRSTLDYVSGIEESFVSPDKLLALRTKRLQNLVNRHRKELELDPAGLPIVRQRALLIDATPEQLAAAKAAGFGVTDEWSDAALGLRLTTLSTPASTPTAQAIAALASANPGLQVEPDYVYEPAGSAGAEAGSSAGSAQAPAARPAAPALVMIDGGVATDHAALKNSGIETMGFAGKYQATGHGTAVASLLVGNLGEFRGAALGARLYSADIYGGNPASGSASRMVKALAWAASKRPAVVTVSLAGPKSVAVGRAIAAVQKGGAKVVAATGNDGSMAPASYPASYAGVISVTGTDRTGKPIMEAGRAEHVDFGAPAVDLVAAVPGSGFMAVRGTSFAAPLVAGRLIQTSSFPRLIAEAVPGSGEVGLGIVCGKCGVSPTTLAKR
ncbi:S8 family serine peptidase [Sphingomonas rhizophila]|uniref:S8 family serine peptidase n=1 Tax=Sphingomonas rhizophila TaxID=2071607 RepID=A0A7G9S8S1_9SPHN|nr:S8 family serine peptidase [Sphingomonas rhizophila]QNN64246.1 S8 family serine peptidase [Sphingomonas rhizophila]